MGPRAALRASHAYAQAPPIWLTHHNRTRNHSSLSNRPPTTRVRNRSRHDNQAAAARYLTRTCAAATALPPT
jgi:hypothetical protein